MRKFKLFLIFIGLAVLAVDIYMSHRGASLCPFEGCRVVAETPFARIWGIPLNYWGIVFFVVSLFLIASDYLFAYWVSVGLGFSLYLVFLQFAVIKKVCQLCLFVEIIVFIMFVASLNTKFLKKMLLFVIIGFFVTHAFYTFPPPYKTDSLKQLATWRGNGELVLDFFFDPDCPGCEKVFKKLAGERKLIKQITFRCVPVHPGSFGKGVRFYELCENLKDPWKAFEVVHKEAQSETWRSYLSPYRFLLEENRDFIDFLGAEAVPTVVSRGTGFMRVMVGYAQFSRWLDERRKEQKAPESNEFFAPLEGVCTPKRCD